ncbi:MAG: hypothetical protein M3295_03110 [Chloroflexota bacterium]|nr:hypothetical protein [Chloroflexota bacterium]
MTDERKIDEERVREEHLENVNVGAHWLYMFGVLAGGFVVMVALMALMGGGG